MSIDGSDPLLMRGDMGVSCNVSYRGNPTKPNGIWRFSSGTLGSLPKRPEISGLPTTSCNCSSHHTGVVLFFPSQYLDGGRADLGNSIFRKASARFPHWRALFSIGNQDRHLPIFDISAPGKNNRTP